MAKNLVVITRELFYFVSAALALLIGLEIISPNIILAYFNLNYLVIIWLATGLFLLIKQ
jgi:hypothetical protein